MAWDIVRVAVEEKEEGEGRSVENKSEEFRQVSKEEFLDFLRSYPYPLERDFYMDWWSWNDFRDGRKWPESMVAVTDDYGEESVYKIRDCYIK